MLGEKKLSFLSTRIIRQAIGWPFFYLVLGLIFNFLGYIDNLFNITRYKNIFNVTEHIGDVFIAFAFISFFYISLCLILKSLEHRYHEQYPVGTMMLSNLRKVLRIIFLLAAVNITLTMLSPSQTGLIIANKMITVIIISSIGWLAVQMLDTIETFLMHKIGLIGKKDRNRIKTLQTKLHLSKNLATLMIILITLAAILMSFNSVRNIGISLLASAGFLTAIVGFAAQKGLFSLFSGLQIALSQPIKIGDMVMVENTWGMVEEITFTNVRLKLGDKRRLIVPISYFVDKPFQNWSREGENLCDSFSIFIDFLMPIEPLRAEFERILDAEPLWDQRARKLQVAAISERSVELRLQVSAENADQLGDLRAIVRERLLTFIQKHHPEGFPMVRLESKSRYNT